MTYAGSPLSVMVTRPNSSILRFTARKSVRSSRMLAVAVLVLMRVKHYCFTPAGQPVFPGHAPTSGCAAVTARSTRPGPGGEPVAGFAMDHRAGGVRCTFGIGFRGDLSRPLQRILACGCEGLVAVLGPRSRSDLVASVKALEAVRRRPFVLKKSTNRWGGAGTFDTEVDPDRAGAEGKPRICLNGKAVVAINT